MAGLLKEDVKAGGDFCRRVVDLAVEVADITVLLSLKASKSLGLESAASFVSSSLFAADTACNAESRSDQAQLDEVLTSTQGSSSYLVADASAPDGAVPTLAYIFFVTHAEAKSYLLH